MTNLVEEYFSVFRNSAYGRSLSTKIRYSIYKPEGIDNDTWIQFIGPNANNLEHMLNTYNQVVAVLEHSDLSGQDKEQLYLSALIHDWGESIIGDIDYNLKRDSDEDDEKLAFTKITAELFPSDTDRQLLGQVYNNIAMDRSSRLGEIFNAMERIGYLSDSFHVARHLQSNTFPELLQAGEKIIHSIVMNQTQKLISLAEKYQYIDSFLVEHRVELMQLIELISTEDKKYMDMWQLYLK